MASANTTWKVLPHQPIEKLCDRMWRVEGELGMAGMKRVMTVVQRADDQLIIHNAIALGDAEMAEIDAWGKVAMIAVPNGYHRMDARVFADRYPAAEIVCPKGSRARVEKVVKVARTYDEIPSDEVVTFEHVDGTKQREGVMIVRANDGTSVVINDVVLNMPHGSGFHGFVIRYVTASSGGPRVSRLSRIAFVSDTAALRGHLERLAGLPDLRRVIVSHHVVIDDNPAAVLREVARAL
ncbi:MAG: hypothetical protein AB7P03_05800 [Kofleriaceae bacterium]